MRCPLPIDWLEYLEGARSDELTLHLSTCLPCQILLDQLTTQVHSRVPLKLSPTLTERHDWPRWHELVTSSPAFGDIWLTSLRREEETAEVSRIPLLVLSNPWEEGGRMWIEVVPISNDIEDATALDAVLSRGDTDLEVPWRAILRHQSVAQRDDLGTCIGRLTSRGKAFLQDVVSGRAPEDRFGAPVEGPDDARLALPEDMEHAVRRIGQAYARMLERDESDERVHRVVVFTMHRPTAPELSDEPLRLAAASNWSTENIPWVVEIPQRGSIRGRIEHRYFDDDLQFVIEEVVQEQLGLTRTAWFAIWSDRVATPVTSRPFLPAVGERVSIARGRGIFPREITRLELRLSDEV
jgi:hypothetical protein